MRRQPSTILKHSSELSARMRRRLCGICAVAVLVAPAIAGAGAAEPETAATTRRVADRTEGRIDRTVSITLDSIPTLHVPLSGGAEWIDPGPRGGGACNEPVTVTHTDGDFTGDTFNVQAGFVEDEIATASYRLRRYDFPIRIDTMEFLFAQRDAIEPTVTAWSVIIWDGLPGQDNGSVVGWFSSDDIILPHVRLDPGTQAARLVVSVDPDDPEPIFILNQNGTDTFTIGFRIDHHNAPPDDPCAAPPSDRNAFPATDTSGVAAPNDNWIYALNCPGLCPTGWRRFSELGPCQPSGDWFIRATFTRTAVVCSGACCEPEGGCLDGVESPTCDLIGGTFMGAGTDCGQLTCPDLVGGCCRNGACLTDLTEVDCLAISGAYLGNGTECVDSPCDSGACCMYDGSCVDLIASECDTAGGGFQGIDTACDSFACPQPTGSCCIGVVCLTAQTQAACEQAGGAWNGIDSTCDLDPCCLEAAFVEARPRSGTVDARQPHPVDETQTRQGIGGMDEPISITLNVSGAQADCFTLCETASDPKAGPNEIVGVTETPSMGTYDIQLLRPITTGAVTTILFNDAPLVTYTSHPANAAADPFATATGIVRLIDYIDEVDPPYGVYSADIDHSGAANTADILRLIDLLSGADFFQPWEGTELPPNQSCPQ